MEEVLLKSLSVVLSSMFFGWIIFETIKGSSRLKSRFTHETSIVFISLCISIFLSVFLVEYSRFEFDEKSSNWTEEDWDKYYEYNSQLDQDEDYNYIRGE